VLHILGLLCCVVKEIVVRILVTFRESLLLVTAAAGIRYLVLVTLIVTRSLKLLTRSAAQALHGSSQSLYSYRPNEAYVYRKHARKNSIKYKNIATNTTGYDKETCLNIHENVYYLITFNVQTLY